MPRVSPTDGLSAQLATESVGEHVVAPERDLCDHAGRSTDPRPVRRPARRRSSRRRATSGRAGSPADRSPPHAICCAVACMQVAIGDQRTHPARVHHRPLERLHATHRAADHRHPARDAEVLVEPRLGAHHVADRDHREARPVRLAVERDAATPARSTPGSRRARSRTRRSTCRCRSACPGRPCRPTSPARGGRGPPVPRRDCRRSRRDRAGRRSMRRHRGSPRSRRRRHVGQRRPRVEREASVGGEREELTMPGVVAGHPGAGHGKWAGRHVGSQFDGSMR